MRVEGDRWLERARSSVPLENANELAARMRSGAACLLVDVREADEVDAGMLPGARHVPRGFLELRIETLAAIDEPIVLYCASGTRSLLAARTLLDMGFKRVSSLAEGIEGWKAAGLPVERPNRLDAAGRRRYARHLRLSEVGEEGQLRLRSASALVIGAGGLGSPVCLYLAAAGVGRIGIVDSDRVEVSNLQRQIIHRTQDEACLKVESAKRAIVDLNPDVEVHAFPERFSASNADALLAPGWDVVVDGTDLIPGRYVIGDACIAARTPLVHGAVHRFEGQVTVFAPALGGPCYRCLFPSPPPSEAIPTCAEAGVMGALPGIIGTLQAMEALKLILALGEPLVGRLLRYDGLRGVFEEMSLPRDPGCIGCGEPAYR